MQVTRKGVPTELTGTQPTVGEPAPDFKLLDLENEVVSLESLRGKTILMSVFPDINTKICDLQTREFFQRAHDMPEVTILNISNNTKEELQEWCATNGVDSLMLHDDDETFAATYGLWMPEFKVLARSIFVIDGAGKLVYSEIVPEMGQEPNYDVAIAAAKNA